MIKLNKSTAPSLLTLAVFVLLLLSSLIPPGDSVSELFLSDIVLQILIFILPSLFYCKLCKVPISKNSSMTTWLPIRFILLAGLFGVLVLGSMLINLGVYSLAGSVEQIGSSSAQTLTQIESVSGALYVVVAFCIVPAVAEEFFFRGILLSEYSENGRFAALVITSLVFAMAHFDLMQLPAYFFSGMILGFSLVVTRSLLAPILLHCASNLFNIFLAPYLWQITFAPLGVLFTVFILIGLLLLFAILALREAEDISTEYAYDPRRTDDKPLPPKKSLSMLLRNLLCPPYLVCVLLFLIAAIFGRPQLYQ